MEDNTNYTNFLSIEEKTTLENLISKLAASGIKQYNTQAAIILFTNWYSLNDYDSLETSTIDSLKTHVNPIREIEDNLMFLDDYVRKMQDMLKSKPIVTNLELIRQYIDTINTKISNLKIN